LPRTPCRLLLALTWIHTVIYVKQHIPLVFGDTPEHPVADTHDPDEADLEKLRVCNRVEIALMLRYTYMHKTAH